MCNDTLSAIVARLTYNGAVNLRRTIEQPSDTCPDMLAGGQRIYTGLGKWTSLAAGGVIRHLETLQLVHQHDHPHLHHHPWDRFVCCCLTPLGREVAEHVHHHWDELEFRDPQHDRK